MVGSVGPVIGRFRPFWVDQRPFNTFMTVRPISSGGLVAAKLRMALVIVLSSWVFVSVWNVGVHRALAQSFRRDHGMASVCVPVSGRRGRLRSACSRAS